MKKYSISPLCNNPILLKNMVENLDESIKKETKFVIFTDDRLKDIVNDLNDICIKNNIDADIITATQVNNKLKENVVDSTFVDSYYLSMQILMYWYIIKYYDFYSSLYIDDDVILMPQVLDLFKADANFMYYRQLNAVKDKKDKSTQLVNKIINETFGAIYTIDYDTWSKEYLTGGFRLIKKSDFDIELYEKGLKGFFTSDILEQKWIKRRSFRCFALDERVLTLFVLNSNMKCESLNKHAILLDAKLTANPKIVNRLKTKAIWHCGNAGTKYITYNNLVDLKMIKCDKYTAETFIEYK